MVIDAIDRALKQKGLSDAAASKLAVGHPSLIKNLRMPREGDKRYNWTALEKLAEALDLELYFGPHRDVSPVATTEFAGDEFAAVPRYDVEFSAGPGLENVEDMPTGAIAFRRDWLDRKKISPGHSMVVSVKGDSMVPTLHDGDLVLVDRRRTTPRGRRIYALIGPDGEARVKRVERLPNTLLLQSDNEQIPTELIPEAEADRIQILGEVVWWGHTV
ncbi:MAG: helix-turn-helix transcriptional regulator, partial [Paracoccus sp. (in: a-proteobacteria)]